MWMLSLALASLVDLQASSLLETIRTYHSSVREKQFGQYMTQGVAGATRCFFLVRLDYLRRSIPFIQSSPNA